MTAYLFLPFQSLDLSLTLISGLTGAQLGRPVPFNLTGQGRLIGPLLHETQKGAYYILFGLGKGINQQCKGLRHDSAGSRVISIIRLLIQFTYTGILQDFVLMCVSKGNVEAISLRDIYIRATGQMPLTQALKIRDPGWEEFKKTNSSSFIHIYRYASVTGTWLWLHWTDGSLSVEY